MKKNTSVLTNAFILVVFTAYWAVTVLCVSPSNYIKIKSDGIVSVFNTFFYQKWSFFAPPPMGSHRLYYTFYDQDTSVVGTYEVLKNIADNKYESLPFNSREEAVDYMVNGSISNILDALIEFRKEVEINYPDTSKSEAQIIAMGNVNKVNTKIASYGTLLNFGEVVGRQNLEDHEMSKVCLVQFNVMEIKLPKFTERALLLEDSIQRREAFAFRSAIFPIKLYDKAKGHDG